MSAPALQRTLPAAPRRSSATAALAAPDAWRLARHPFVLAGVALGVGMVVGTGFRVNGAFELLLGYGLLPLSIGTSIAAQLLTSRARRNDTAELENTTPTGAFFRARAALVAIAGPVVVGVVFIVAAFVYLGAWNGVPVALEGGVRDIAMHPAEVAQGLVGVAFFGAMGAALGAWIPSRFVPPVMLAGLLFVFTVLGWSADGWVRWALPLTHHETQSLDWVQVTPGYGYGIVAGYDRVAMTWHIGYVVALSALLGSIALLRYRRDRTMIGATIALTALTAALSVVQLP